MKSPAAAGCTAFFSVLRTFTSPRPPCWWIMMNRRGFFQSYIPFSPCAKIVLTLQCSISAILHSVKYGLISGVAKFTQTVTRRSMNLFLLLFSLQRSWSWLSKQGGEIGLLTSWQGVSSVYSHCSNSVQFCNSWRINVNTIYLELMQVRAPDCHWKELIFSFDNRLLLMWRHGKALKLIFSFFSYF